MLEEKTINLPIRVTPILTTGRADTKTYNWVMKLGQENDKYYGSVSCEENGVNKHFPELESKDEESAINELRDYCTNHRS